LDLPQAVKQQNSLYLTMQSSTARGGKRKTEGDDAHARDGGDPGKPDEEAKLKSCASSGWAWKKRRKKKKKK